MIIELNINLNIIGRRNALFECDARAKTARRFLRDFFTAVAFERVRDQAEGNDGMLHDVDVLVAGINTNNTTPDSAVLKVYELAELLEQHCIAVYLPHSNSGMIVGPRADGWPAFDLAEFYRWKFTYSNPGKPHPRVAH